MKMKITSTMVIAVMIMLSAVLYVEAQDTGFTEEQAMNALIQAEEDMQEMTDAGFSIKLVNDTFTEAKKAFTGENYSKLIAEAEKINNTKKREEVKRLVMAAQDVAAGAVTDYNVVVEKADEIRETKERAFEIDDFIKALEMRIEDLRDTVDVSDVEEILNKARQEFHDESYDNAEELANQGFDLLDSKAAEATQLKLIYRTGRENAVNFVKERWLGISITIIVLAILIFVSHRIISTALSKRRLKDLKLEEDVLNDLIKIAQKERFQKGKITKKEYEIKVQRFKERLVEVNKEIPIVAARLKGEKLK